MSQRDDSLSQYMLGTMGGGNGGLDAAYGQMHAMMAAEDRRQAEWMKRQFPERPRPPLTPQEVARNRKVLGWLVIYVIVMTAAVHHFGFRPLWGYCAMLVIETALWIGIEAGSVWRWGRWAGLLLLALAGGLATSAVVGTIRWAWRAAKMGMRMALKALLRALHWLGRGLARGGRSVCRRLVRSPRFSSGPSAAPSRARST
ncbi:hypothetical protein [Roseococcus sp. SYP-B2431]|uniref:hypothetical protein n=1 Tax=Roseococcus sp. SYP-B2431 TaxID=2496640 RepID=UPI0013F3B203|nr:hypothetical protein [Roseococcus sp. SYP-B2431]